MRVAEVLGYCVCAFRWQLRQARTLTTVATTMALFTLACSLDWIFASIMNPFSTLYVLHVNLHHQAHMHV